MNFFLLVCFSLFVFAQYACSMPSGHDVVQVNVEIFNSSGIFGNWGLSGKAPTCGENNTSQSYATWSQSDKQNGGYSVYGVIGIARGWLEIVADVSGLNGFNTSTPYFGGVRILDVLTENYENVAAISVWPSSNGTGISGYVMTNWSLNRDTEFFIPTGGFHRYTLGYDYETSTVSVYVDDVLATSKTFSSLCGTYAHRFFCGYDAGDNVREHGTGVMHIQECSFYRQPVKTVYVDASKGLDTNDGLSESTPVKTLKTASGRAMKGTTIYVADGIYREYLTLPSGTEEEQVALIGTGDNVYISGSIPASDFVWEKDPNTSIWSANVSSKITKAPLIVTYRDKKTHEFVRLYQARTPNYRVDTPWKFTEFWNIARGGSKIMDCFGDKDCDDEPYRSTNMLADEAFKTMDDLVGAQLFVTNCQGGHDRYNNTIIKHNKTTGVITIDKDRYFMGRVVPLGMYSMYYVYGKRSMIDAEGEYAYEDGILYIKWSEDQLPNQLEFSNAGIGLSLSEKSYVKIQNIHFSHFEGAALGEYGGRSKSHTSSHDVFITECSFEYCLRGVDITVDASDKERMTYNWHIEHCTFTHMDSRAIYTLPLDAEANFPHVPYSDIWITNNYFYHLNFHSEGAAGIEFISPRNIYFLNNTVNYTSHNAVYFHSPVSKDGVHATGNCLIRGNLVDGSCSGNPDCGCIKIEWVKNTNYVWKNMLVMENLCQNSFGYSKGGYYRDNWFDRSYDGHGIYLDCCTGPVIYRNIVFNAGADSYVAVKNHEREGLTYIYNNLGVGGMIGLVFTAVDREQTAKAFIKNNAFIDSGKYGFWRTTTPEELLDFNNNLYYHIGWENSNYSGGLGVVQDVNNKWLSMKDFDALHKLIPTMETTKYDFDPEYKSYYSIFNRSYDERHKHLNFEDGTFEVTDKLMDKGTETLPDEVKEVLDYFKIPYTKVGSNYDIGPYEKGIESWIPSSSNSKRSSSSSGIPSDVPVSRSLRTFCFLTPIICLIVCLISH